MPPRGRGNAPGGRGAGGGPPTPGPPRGGPPGPGPRGGGGGRGRGRGGGGGGGGGGSAGPLAPAAHVQTIGVRRPGQGQSGKQIKVATNHFVVTIPEAIIHHYDGMSLMFTA